MDEDLGEISDTFLPVMKLIEVRSEQDVRRYAMAAVDKMLKFRFAEICVFELWFCATVCQLASLPPAADEALVTWRKHMFASLRDMFSQAHVAPDYRASNLLKAVV